ncbi:alpha/beta hydrolase [Acinetobacter sp.]|uniref:alpha/beta hydrolase n=1 Tax=Acinetobacter sp. TaxID=472 RepID=UPI002FD91EFB
MKQVLAWTISHTLRPALSPKVPLKIQRLCSDLASTILMGPSGYKTQKQMIGQILTLEIQPKTTLEGYGVLYLHGGGYVVGSAKSHAKLAAHLGHAIQVKVWLPEYRLAPEHPSPAAMEDALFVYKTLLANGQDSNKLIIAGDSAGGGLSLLTAIAIREAGLPQPAALVLLSPWVDLSLSGESLKTHIARDAMLTPEWLQWCAQNYSGKQQATSPSCSPLYADLSGLAPTLIHVGTEELLLDDAKRIAQKLEKDGVTIQSKVYNGVGHVFQFHAGILKEANQSIREIADFAHRHLS